MWIFPLIQIYKYTHTLHFSSARCDHWLRYSARYSHLCRWRLQRVVVQNDALQLCELSVTHRDGSHFITGEVQTNQRQICQLWAHKNTYITHSHTSSFVVICLPICPFCTLRRTHTICIRDWLLTIPTWLANVCVCVCVWKRVHARACVFVPAGSLSRWFLRTFRSRRASSWPTWGGRDWISLQLTS